MKILILFLLLVATQASGNESVVLNIGYFPNDNDELLLLRMDIKNHTDEDILVKSVHLCNVFADSFVIMDERGQYLESTLTTYIPPDVNDFNEYIERSRGVVITAGTGISCTLSLSNLYELYLHNQKAYYIQFVIDGVILKETMKTCSLISNVVKLEIGEDISEVKFSINEIVGGRFKEPSLGCMKA